MEFTSPVNSQALRKLLHNINSIESASEQSPGSLAIFRESLQSSIPVNGGDLDEYHIAALFESCRKLADHADDALINHPDYFAELFSVLAIATREEPVWRVCFGRSEVDHTRYTQSSNAEPDSVLEVARRVTAVGDLLPSATFQSALKIIANCCADNNENRKVIIHRDGIRLLLRLTEREVDLDALVLSIYNVCVDYDEPATYFAAEAHTVPDTTTSSLSEDIDEVDGHDDGAPSLAIEYLAAAYSSDEGLTTFELLLSLESKVSDHIQPYLAELVDMATQPGLNGLEHIQSRGHPWTWSFSINGKTHDTVAYMARMSQNDLGSLLHMNGAVLNLLSQQAAITALLKRKDEAVWSLLTLSCLLEDDLDDETDQTLLGQRKALLKLLYQVTGDSSFAQDLDQALILFERCVTQLEIYGDEYVESGSQHEIQHHRNSSQPLIVASACVVLAQLAVSDNLRDNILHSSRLTVVLDSLLAFETSPDILYPSVSMISRLSLTNETSLPIILAGILNGMQRLLTLKGIGMIVPVETMIAYKTIVRNRPEAVKSLLQPGLGKRTTIADVLTLWNLTMDSGTRLEIGKFFLEVFRTIIPALQEHELHPSTTKNASLLKICRGFLASSASGVAEVFVWLCLKAEPTQQRDHGWFGLAMLSIWPEAKAGIIKVLGDQQDIRNEILRVSKMQGGAVPNNLKLVLSKLLTGPQGGIAEVTRDVLRSASHNLNLTLPGQE